MEVDGSSQDFLIPVITKHHEIGLSGPTRRGTYGNVVKQW